MGTEKEVTKEWRVREKRRMEDGTYIKVPWEDEGWYLSSPRWGVHFPHPSVNDKNLIAYTPDEGKGERDVRNSAKPRKYLLKHFSYQLSEASINSWAEKFMLANNPVTVEIAMTRDDIRWVYEHGQTGCNPEDDDGTGSCMTYEIGHYYSYPIHPVEAYAYGDLGIAFTTYQNKGKQVSARGLVWPEKKGMGRIFGRYGKENELRTWLESQGYNHNSMLGAKLLKLVINNPNNSEMNGKYVMPYLDCFQTIGVYDDYLLIERGGRGCADSQHGHLRHNGEHQRSDDEFCCGCCEDWYHIDNQYTALPNGSGICEGCYDEHYFTCEDCDAVINHDYSYSINDGDKYVCESCYADEYQFCESCGTAQHVDDMAGEYDGNMICSDCVTTEGLHVKETCGTVVSPTNYEIEVAQCPCCDDHELNREEV